MATQWQYANNVTIPIHFSIEMSMFHYYPIGFDIFFILVLFHRLPILPSEWNYFLKCGIFSYILFVWVLVSCTHNNALDISFSRKHFPLWKSWQQSCALWNENDSMNSYTKPSLFHFSALLLFCHCRYSLRRFWAQFFVIFIFYR